MWALQTQPSLSGVFAIESSEVMEAHVIYAPWGSCGFTPVVLDAVISWLLKILGSQRASRELLSESAGELVRCVWGSLGAGMGCPQVMGHSDPLQLFSSVSMFSFFDVI